MKRLVAFLLALPVYANEPPFLPVASCDNGVCTMKEEDYEKFQRFHAQVYETMRELQSNNEYLSGELAKQSNLLNRNLHCQLKRV